MHFFLRDGKFFREILDILPKSGRKAQSRAWNEVVIKLFFARSEKAAKNAETADTVSVTF